MTNAVLSRLFQKMNLFPQNELAPHPPPLKTEVVSEEYQTLWRNNLLHIRKALMNFILGGTIILF